MMLKVAILYTVLAAGSIAGAQQYTTPVPILKQINRQNDDGSYSYGYEAADKSYKIETKYSNGEVFGKYGYVDDRGQLREIEYGASRRGFEPQGSDINVPPPTLKSSNPYPLAPNQEDDGQYREDPRVYFKQYANNKQLPASRFQLNNFEQPQPQPRYNPPAQQQQPFRNYQPYNPPPPPPPQQQHRFQQQPYYQPQQPQPNYNNVNVPTHHHPALRNLDIWSGSYSIDYTGR